MNCLVTGGTGYVGCNVARALTERGNTVVVVDACPRPDALAEALGGAADSVAVVRGDVTLLPTLLRLVERHSITHVVHLAGAQSQDCSADPPAAMRLNIEGMTTVLEACRLAAIQRLVWASSGAVYGGGYSDEELIPNDAVHTPNGIYGASKSFSEALARHYFDAYGVDSIGLRFGAVGGSGMRGGAAERIVHELVEKPAFGEAGTVPWGDDSVNWFWVADAARAVRLALEVDETKARAFNMAGDYRSIRDVADFVQRLFPGASIKLEPGKFGLAHRLDASAAAQELGFIPDWTMEMQVVERANAARARRGLPAVGAPDERSVSRPNS